MRPASRPLCLWTPLRQVQMSPAAAASPVRTFSASHSAYMLFALQHIHRNAVHGNAFYIKHAVNRCSRLCGSTLGHLASRQAASKKLGTPTTSTPSRSHKLEAHRLGL